MKALVAAAYGPLEQLRVHDVPDPSPGPGQVQVRVQAAALNPIDVKLVTGELRAMFPVTHPFVPGVDATGVVAAVGEGVTRFAAGDEVIAYAGAASAMIAEYALVGEGPELVHRPRALSPVHAAALPMAAMTAHCVLAAALEPGDSALVIRALGGARDHRPHRRRHPERGPAAAPRRAGCGRRPDQRRSRTRVPAGLVRPGGRLVSTLYSPAEVDGVAPVYVRMEASTGDLHRQAERVAAGRMSIEGAATYPLDEAPQATRDLAEGQYTRGKIVITF
ncbi:alcohol dehydrogenase catalytic domain-containing protein [Nonomuraea sp. NPDC001831]|uniref:alcohol dehydrogenase catalytic domain-containing protein n=1 Tax=Nonomuraea sp. NPDC001831 TaxID=3364340 RepID=UPI00367761BF